MLHIKRQRKGSGLIALAVILLITTQTLKASDEPIGEKEMIEILGKVDPEIAAAKFRKTEAEGREKQAKSTYYPAVELQVLEPIPGSFPGSLGHSRVDGVMVSPYHTGFSAGFAATYSLFDFGRTGNRVKQAEQEKLTAELDARIARIEVIERGLNIFYTTLKFRELGRLWSEKDQELRGIEREIVRFVGTGQRSIVDRQLIRSHVERVEREKREFEARYQSGLGVLASLLEIQSPVAQLVPLNAIQAVPGETRIDEQQNPYVQKAESEKRAAEFGLARAKAEHMPELRAFGSAGYIEGSRVVPVQNWAAGFAASLPLFQGFRVQGEVNEAEARVQRIQKHVEATAKKIHETNIRLAQEIRTAQEELRLLEQELKSARLGLATARARYRNFQGNLTDLRETIVTYYHILGRQIETRLNLAYLVKVQALTNGNL